MASIWLRHRGAWLPLQATKFEAEAGAGSKVQHLFNMMSTLLEARMLALKQKCAPAALAVSSSDGSDVEALLDRVLNAIKVTRLDFIALLVSSKHYHACCQVDGRYFCYSNLPHVLCSTLYDEYGVQGSSRRCILCEVK